MKEQLSVKPTAMKWGLIFGTVWFVFGLILQYAGLAQNPVAWVIYAVMIAIIAMAMKEYRTLNDELMPFKKGLGLGVLLSLIGSVISGGASAIYIAFIDNSMIQVALDQAREQLEENPQMTDEAIEMAMGITETMMEPQWLFLMTVAMGVFLGLIFSLIVAAIMKKDEMSESY